MPRMKRDVIRPKIGQGERDQIASTLMEQLGQYYRQTSEETLFTLASSIENQAFRHAQTRHQYSDNLKSLSLQEVEKAYQVHEEINGRSNRLGTPRSEAGMRGHSSAFNNQGTTIPYCGNSDEVDANLREQDKKVEQKLARQRIIARQRKRMRPISTFVRTFRQEAPRPEAEERPCSKNKKVSSPLRNVPSHVDSRASQRRRIDFETLTTDTMEWYNRLIDTADFNVGPSFLEELSGKDFGISEGCDDIESCHSSTGSRATALIDLE